MITMVQQLCFFKTLVYQCRPKSNFLVSKGWSESVISCTLWWLNITIAHSQRLSKMEQTKQLLLQVLSLTVFQLILFPLRNRKGPLLYLTTLANVFLGLDHYGLQICLSGLSEFVLMLFLIFIFSIYSPLYCFNIPLKNYVIEPFLSWMQHALYFKEIIAIHTTGSRF